MSYLVIEVNLCTNLLPSTDVALVIRHGSFLRLNLSLLHYCQNQMTVHVCYFRGLGLCGIIMTCAIGYEGHVWYPTIYSCNDRNKWYILIQHTLVNTTSISLQSKVNFTLLVSLHIGMLTDMCYKFCLIQSHISAQVIGWIHKLHLLRKQIKFIPCGCI